MANQFIEIVEALDASFTASSSIIAAGEPITFTNTTPTLSIVSWDFGDGNSLNFVSPTTYQYGSNYIDSTVTVSMFVSNVLGCMDTATCLKSRLQPIKSATCTVHAVTHTSRDTNTPEPGRCRACAPRALLERSEVAAFGSATGTATLRFLSPASA